MLVTVWLEAAKAISVKQGATMDTMHLAIPTMPEHTLSYLSYLGLPAFVEV